MFDISASSLYEGSMRSLRLVVLMLPRKSTWQSLSGVLSFGDEMNESADSALFLPDVFEQLTAAVQEKDALASELRVRHIAIEQLFKNCAKVPWLQISRAGFKAGGGSSSSSSCPVE